MSLDSNENISSGLDDNMHLPSNELVVFLIKMMVTQFEHTTIRIRPPQLNNVSMLTKHKQLALHRSYVLDSYSIPIKRKQGSFAPLPKTTTSKTYPSQCAIKTKKELHYIHTIHSVSIYHQMSMI